jgi:hypothetical protein
MATSVTILNLRTSARRAFWEGRDSVARQLNAEADDLQRRLDDGCELCGGAGWIEAKSDWGSWPSLIDCPSCKGTGISPF